MRKVHHFAAEIQAGELIWAEKLIRNGAASPTDGDLMAQGRQNLSFIMEILKETSVSLLVLAFSTLLCFLSEVSFSPCPGGGSILLSSSSEAYVSFSSS